MDTFRSHLQPGVKSLVIDAECCAIDREGNRILPFQARRGPERSTQLKETRVWWHEEACGGIRRHVVA